MKIDRNVGLLDRTIRIVSGIVPIVVGAIAVKGTASVVCYVLSVPLLLSAVLGFCPSYTFLGLSTKRKGGGG